MTPEETEKTLHEETDKWMKLGEEAYAKATPKSDKGHGFMINIGAYLKDAKHFRFKGDYVRAFEAVVWAWAWLEIAKEIGEIDF